MKENKMKRCKSCTNYDAVKSNANWTVCNSMPVEVMMSGSSKDCKNYVLKDN